MGGKMGKDWVGNDNSVYKTLASSNHTIEDREEHDFYATEPKAMELLLDEETFSKNVWECACGLGQLSEVLKNRGYNVLSTDLINRGYGQGNVDFLQIQTEYCGDIITNPPYKYATEFIYHALSLIPNGFKVAMFFKNTIFRREKKERII